MVLSLLASILPVVGQIKPITPPKEVETKPIHYVVIVDGVNVNLRKTPEINGNNIITIPLYPEKGDYLEYLGETSDFYQVRYKGFDAYISKRFSFVYNGFVVVNGVNVRLRETPEINDNVITTPLHPENGERLEYIGETNFFYKVRCEGLETYISKQFSHKVINYVVIVDGVNVRLRSTPEINDTNIITTSWGNLHPEKGDQLEYIDETADFYKVRYKGYIAYISKQFSHTIIK